MWAKGFKNRRNWLPKNVYGRLDSSAATAGAIKPRSEMNWAIRSTTIWSTSVSDSGPGSTWKACRNRVRQPGFESDGRIVGSSLFYNAWALSKFASEFRIQVPGSMGRRTKLPRKESSLLGLL